MRRARLACLIGLLLIGLPAVAIAGRQGSKDGPVKSLWADYDKIRKRQDVEENRRRTRIAEELGKIQSEDARRCLCEIFKADPDQRPRLAAMLALCERGDVRTVSRVVAQAANEKGYLGLWLGEALSRARDPGIGPWILGKSKLLTKKRTRIAAVSALGRLRVAGARGPLLKLHESYRKKKNDADLIYEVLRALGRIGGEEAKEVLLGAAAHADPRRRLAAAEVLLEVDNDGKTQDVMRKLLADEDWLVREVAARAVAAARTEYLLADLPPLLEDDRLRVRVAARKTLRAIAGTDLGYDRAGWQTWCKRQASGVQEGPEDTVALTEDERIQSNGVLFLLDISKSMAWQAPTTTTRLEVAQKKLVGLLDRLHEKAVFNIVAVCGKPYLWKKPRGRSGGGVPATKENVEAAKAWVRGLECAVHTNVWVALAEELERHPRIDTVYFLSDGVVMGGSKGSYLAHEEILPRFKEVNRFRKVIVHTSFLMWPPRKSWAEKHEDSDEQAEFLKALADQTGGTFEELRSPPPEED